MICEYFRSTGSYDGVQGLSDQFSIRLQSDDVQDFDVRWDQAISSTSDTPSDKILEGSHKSKLQESAVLQTTLALYEEETIRHGGQPDYFRLRMCVKLQFHQSLRNKNFKIGYEIVERGVVTKGLLGKQTLRGEQSRIVLPVGGKWIMFTRRVM